LVIFAISLRYKKSKLYNYNKIVFIQGALMPSKKNILLASLFISIIYSTFASQPEPSGWKWLQEWFKSWFTTPQQPTSFKKAVAASGKSLDLFNFYEHKEKKQLAAPDKKNSFMDAISAADTFKKAVRKNKSIMERLKNNPNKFLFGASSSSYQYEGGLDSNNANAIFYQSKGLKPAGIAIDFWNRYEKDIELMDSKLGINCFRLSIAWDRVQLTRESWNQNAINTYVKMIKLLRAYDIEPIVVLHHYTIPQWFAEIGGFEKRENIKYFVEFAKKMYEALHEDVTYWSTFNAIEGYAFKGYWTQDGPPGLHNMQLTQTVMAHMIDAHVETYQAIKGPNGMYHIFDTKNIPKPQIGLQKNIVPLDPSEKSNICVRTISGPFCIMGATMQNKCFFDLFNTGIFEMKIPKWINILHINTFAKDSIDWIGVNIYSKMEMRFAKTIPESRPKFKTANINYRDYPEGIYRAVKTIYDNIARPLGIPIIITENGIAPVDDNDEQRTRFFRRALYTIRKLIEEGYPIIGYTPWASHDNYEWPSQTQPDPYDRPYGMFKVNFDKISPDYMKRTLKKGAEYYRDFIKEYFKQQASF